MFKLTKKLVLFSVIFTCHLTLAFPQEDEDGNENPVNEEEAEEEEGQGEEEYYEEGAIKGTATQVKQIVSEKLGITNFSRQALYEQGANALFSLIAKSTQDKIPTKPPTSTISITEPSSVIPSTRKYKAGQRSTTSESPFKSVFHADKEEGIKKTFEITIPNDISNNAGGTIEISIPQHLTSEAELNIVNPNQLTFISKSTEGDGEGVKSIEEAIRQALLLAHQNSGIDLSTLTKDEENTPKIVELDITQPTTTSDVTTVNAKIEMDLNSVLKSDNFSEVITLKTKVSNSTQKFDQGISDKISPEKIVNLQTTPDYKFQPTPEEEYVESEEEVTKRTRKPATTRSTTARPTLTNNPIADMIYARFQNNGISGFFIDRAINSTKTGAKFAAGYVWCALFDYCPDGTEEKEAGKREI